MVDFFLFHRYEQIDADTYVHDWQVDQVKDDGCGICPQHEPFAAMSVALNRTGKPIWYAIHSSILGVGNPNGTVANMWRYKDFDIILHRISRIFQPCTTPHAPCGALFLVDMRVEC